MHSGSMLSARRTGSNAHILKQTPLKHSGKKNMRVVFTVETFVFVISLPQLFSSDQHLGHALQLSSLLLHRVSDPIHYFSVKNMSTLKCENEPQNIGIV